MADCCEAKAVLRELLDALLNHDDEYAIHKIIIEYLKGDPALEHYDWYDEGRRAHRLFKALQRAEAAVGEPVP